MNKDGPEDGDVSLEELGKAFSERIQETIDESPLLCAGYKPTMLQKLMNRKGALRTAQDLLKVKQPATGFGVLKEYGHLELSVEAVVCDPQFSRLFTEKEKNKARKRLEMENYFRRSEG